MVTNNSPTAVRVSGQTTKTDTFVSAVEAPAGKPARPHGKNFSVPRSTRDSEKSDLLGGRLRRPSSRLGGRTGSARPDGSHDPWARQVEHAERVAARYKARLESTSSSGLASDKTLRRRGYVPAPGGGGLRLAKGVVAS